MNQSSATRRPLFEDLAEAVSSPQAARKAIDPSVIQQVSESHDFPSREPRRGSSGGAQAPSTQNAASKSSAQHKPRRFRTGRNIPVNMKLDQATRDSLHRIADELDIPFGEVVERALKAFESGLLDQPKSA